MTTGCGWLVEDDLKKHSCIDSDANGCTGEDGFCIYEDFDNAVYTTNPGGNAPYGMLGPEAYACKINS